MSNCLTTSDATKPLAPVTTAVYGPADSVGAMLFVRYLMSVGSESVQEVDALHRGMCRPAGVLRTRLTADILTVLYCTRNNYHMHAARAASRCECGKEPAS